MARKPENAGLGEPQATSAQVIAYLKQHPEFLARHPELLAQMVPPGRYDEAGSVVDFQQFMVIKLQEELEQMRGCAEHLISTSRNNMSTQNRTHETALATIGAGDMEGLARVVAEDFPSLLDVDICTLGFEPLDGQSRLIPGIACLSENMVEMVLGDGEVMLRSQTPGDPAIFGDTAGLVNSYALVRIEPLGCPLGLLALGSRNERTFQASQGTDLLAFLARILEDCVRRWWPAA